jgi:hypothetical protein
MNPANFELQHSDVDQPKLLDGECATKNWPMPPVKAWEPRPRQEPDLVRSYEWGDPCPEYFVLDHSKPCGTAIAATPEYEAEQERRAEELRVRSMPYDPAEEKNSFAAMLTRVMRWVQQ